MNEKISIIDRIGKILHLTKPKGKEPMVVDQLMTVWDEYISLLHSSLGEYVRKLIEIASNKSWPKTSRFSGFSEEDFYETMFVYHNRDACKEIYAANKKEFDAIKKNTEKKISNSHSNVIKLIDDMAVALDEIERSPASKMKFERTADIKEVRKRLRAVSNMPKGKFVKILLNWDAWTGGSPTNYGELEVLTGDEQYISYGYYDYS